MKKKKDEISRLLDAYGVASAKRIAKENERQAAIQAKANKRKLLGDEVRKKITDVFRPVMKQLISQLDKNLFALRWDKVKGDDDFMELYLITAKKEEEVNFDIAISLLVGETEPKFSYSYTVNYGGKEFQVSIKPSDINEDLIKAAFITCLKKISV